MRQTWGSFLGHFDGHHQYIIIWAGFLSLNTVRCFMVASRLAAYLCLAAKCFSLF